MRLNKRLKQQLKLLQFFKTILLYCSLVQVLLFFAAKQMGGHKMSETAEVLSLGGFALAVLLIDWYLSKKAH